MAIKKVGPSVYDINGTIIKVQPEPIIAERIPTSVDKAEIGTVWIYKESGATDNVYMMTSITANVAEWVNMGGGSGSFDALTVNPGDITVTAGDINVTAGDLTLTAGDLELTALTTDGVVSTTSGVLGSSAGTNGQILIGETGAAPTWQTITAGAGITVTNTAHTITIANPGVTGTSMTTSDANNVVPDGAGITNVIGYDTNIVTDGATANTVKVRLADSIVSVAAITATNDFTMTAGTCTVTSDDNATDAIYLHANGGVNEQINIYSDQGTAVNSIYMHSDVGGLTLTSGLASADAINIAATNAASGIDIDCGSAGVNIAALNGPVALISGTGAISIGADATDHSVEIGDAAGVNAMSLISGTGHTAMTSTGNITLDAAGVLEINSSAGIIGIGNDAVAQNINVGTGAAARTITVGNSSGASSVILDVGTGNLDLGVTATAHITRLGSTNTTSQTIIQSGTGDLSLTSTDDITVDAAGVLELNSSDGIISIGNDADAFNINVGTGASERIVTIGNGTTATSVVLNVGTGNLDLGVNATAHTTRLGSTNTTSATTVQAGSGALIVNGGGDITVDAVGVLELNSSAGIISVGNDAIAQNINIGTGASARVITIGNNTTTTGVAITSGTGDIALSSEDDITLDVAATGVIALNSAGLISTEVATDTQAAAAVTINANAGIGIFTGLTTAAAASQVFTITNSICTAASAILVTAANFGANDAQMTVTRVIPDAGSFTVTLTNFGAAALNGNVAITFWILAA